jgi:hypothetical protein
LRFGIRIGGGLESGLLRDLELMVVERLESGLVRGLESGLVEVWNQDWWRFGIRIVERLESGLVEVWNEDWLRFGIDGC